MKFLQLDSITELVPGSRIVATRTLRADEEFLRDHFPLFPVMPGVLMLEALYQASCHLVRASDDFQCSLLTMQEVRNVKFADFVEPGDTLVVEAELVKNSAEQATLKAFAKKGEATTVSARIIIAKKKFGPDDPSLEPLDRFLAEYPRREMQKLQSAR